ncbi:hypothetical protein [Nonomuraea sp. NEAU-A123]|uniref:hypothetical protein n=1 Tax=Nonomuraea sp. NEAU-A123 TaxID=2839649 RepID=UPI001BE44939|nr:hypothetical protein [Nonomuraea sp. NEAU-A123]MBT2226230.1 hypothetical protein [Nonomuraea sp. NEAU-A123]
MTIAPEAMTSDDLRAILDVAVEDMWVRADLMHERGWQPELGISALGGCEREAAYIIAGTPPSDAPPPTRAAILGTWLHEKILPLLADSLGGCEVEGTLFVDGLKGHSDLYVTLRRPDGTGIVVDLKTCTESAISKARRLGPKRNHNWQVHGYGKGRRDAGQRVDWVALLYIDRARGEHYVWISPYDEAEADAAMRWLFDVRAVAKRNPDLAPRGCRGPGLDWKADACKWVTRCWPDRQKTIRTELDDQGPAIEAALKMRLEGSEREADGKSDKSFAEAILDGLPEGEYGPYRLGWRSNGERMNQKVAAERLKRHGLEVPRNAATYSARVTYIGDQPPEETTS